MNGIVIVLPEPVERSTIQTCSPMMATKAISITDYFDKLQRLHFTQPQKKRKMEEEYLEFLDRDDFEELTQNNKSNQPRKRMVTSHCGGTSHVLSSKGTEGL